MLVWKENLLRNILIFGFSPSLDHAMYNDHFLYININRNADTLELK